MAPIVSLRTLVDEMDGLGEEMRGFLNRRTGEVVCTALELLSKAEEGDDENLLEWQVEMYEELCEILESSDWLQLPRRDSHEDYRLMERFCLERCEGRLQDKLLSALRGRGAFGRFRDCLHRHGVQEQWYQFRHEALAEEAAAWLEEQGIAYGP